MKTHPAPPPNTSLSNKLTKLDLVSNINCIQSHLNVANEILNGSGGSITMVGVLEVIQADVDIIKAILAKIHEE